MTTNQQADRLAEEAKTWISQVCIAAHRHSPAQTKVAVEALEAFIEALATLARTPSVPDDVAIPVSIAGKMRPHVRADFDSDANFEAAAAARASHEGEQQ